MRYAAIYGYNIENNRREHLGNVTNLKYTENTRTFDFNSTSISGRGVFDTNKALIYVINDARGRQISAGFAKNIKQTEDYGVEFIGDDFKRIMDTDVLIDFTGEQNLVHTLEMIFSRTANAVQASNRDDFMSKVNLDFIIPADSTDVKFIADYTNQYIVVNALSFLKVYLSYFGYYIRTSYDVVTDTITIEFKKAPETRVDINLKDFIHDRTTNDIKTNKTIATLSYTPVALDPEWLESDELYYLSQPDSNRASVIASDKLPATNGYSPGFALEVRSGYQWDYATAEEYNTSQNKGDLRIQKTGPLVCTYPPFNVAVKSAGDVNNYNPNTVIRVMYYFYNNDGSINLCNSPTNQTYIKPVFAGTTATYYRISDVPYSKRPNLPERVYLLGKDNQIYEGYHSIDEANRIYPVVSKIFEAQYLAEAQLNAVYELVNNRYIENIIITTGRLLQPIDLAEFELYTMVRVYDSVGGYKDLPIAEKTLNYSQSEITTQTKLGFKKTLLIEIIKNDLGEPGLIKSTGGSGGGSSTVIEEKAEVWVEPTEPDPNDYNTWFKPIEEDSSPMAKMSISLDEPLVQEISQDDTVDTGKELAPEKEPSAGIELVSEEDPTAGVELEADSEPDPGEEIIS